MMFLAFGVLFRLRHRKYIYRNMDYNRVPQKTTSSPKRLDTPPLRHLTDKKLFFIFLEINHYDSDY